MYNTFVSPAFSTSYSLNDRKATPIASERPHTAGSVTSTSMGSVENELDFARALGPL